MIDVFHNGNRETILSNRGEEPVLWKAAFLGEHEAVVCEDEKIPCMQEQNEAGEALSFVLIEVKAGESRRVRIRD